MLSACHYICSLIDIVHHLKLFVYFICHCICVRLKSVVFHYLCVSSIDSAEAAETLEAVVLKRIKAIFYTIIYFIHSSLSDSQIEAGKAGKQTKESSQAGSDLDSKRYEVDQLLDGIDFSGIKSTITCELLCVQ